MLLDTSGLLCFLHKDEPQHERAVELIATTSRTRLTHNCVLAELVALALVRGFSRSIVLSYSLELINIQTFKLYGLMSRYIEKQ